METGTKKKARIAALNEEMDGIHFLNSLYLGAGRSPHYSSDNGMATCASA
jgi:hypothetical protein